MTDIIIRIPCASSLHTGYFIDLSDCHSTDKVCFKYPHIRNYCKHQIPIHFKKINELNLRTELPAREFSNSNSL